MESIDTVSDRGYSSKTGGDKGIINTFYYLTNRYGHIDNIASSFVHDDHIAKVLENIHKTMLWEKSPLFDLRTLIVSDWVFFLRQALAGRNFEYLDEVVTCFDMTGISTVQEDLVERERQDVISHEIPEAITRDMVQMDEMESILDKNHVKKVLEFGGKSKFYHRMITGALSIIDFFDWHFKWRLK